ncbi:MAG: ABC transporter ATP-binding protein [Rubrivivax sp.]
MADPAAANSVASGAGSAAGIGLQVADLRVVFDGHVAVDGVSFGVDPGESFGIVGESGSGKSTVLRAICGLAPRTAGSVSLTRAAAAPATHPADLPDPASREGRRQLQMVFQDPYGSLHPRQTVDRILAEPLAIHRIGSGDEREARIEQALQEVGLGNGFRFRYPHQLSGGQRQRVAVARALILKPQVLLLDEPTSALDASVQAEVLNLLEDLQQRHGLTYVMVSHDLAVVTHLCRRLMVMRRGLTFLMVSHDLAVVTHLCQRLMVMQRGQTVELLSSSDLVAHRVQADYTRLLMQASLGFGRATPTAA